MEAQHDEIKSKATIKILDQLRECIIDCAKNIKSNDATFNISTLPTVSDDLGEYMGKYIDAIQEIESYQKAFVDINRKLDEIDEQDDEPEEYVDLDVYTKMFDEIVDHGRRNYTPNEMSAQLELETILRPPEEEIQVEAPTRQIPKDPMTKRPIQIAMRSTVCNHIYDKNGIEGYFELKKSTNKANRIQCPHAGCTNKNMSKKELVLDEETNKLIQSLL